MMMTTEWRDKVALVTGGSRGIGRHIALKLAESGMKIAVNYRGNAEAAQQTEELLRQQGVDFLLIPSDIADISQAQSLIGTVRNVGYRFVPVKGSPESRDSPAGDAPGDIPAEQPTLAAER